MAAFSIFAVLVTLQTFFLLISGAPAPAPLPPQNTSVSHVDAAASSWWFASISRQGTVPFGTAGYKVFRNVQDYGAKGDGTSDDTVAINSAITDGSRCGQGCDSSTTTPAIIYFPPGTYMVNAPLVQLYCNQPSLLFSHLDFAVLGLPKSVSSSRS
jgi:glucan 1,3-beta-glucosidase